MLFRGTFEIMDVYGLDKGVVVVTGNRKIGLYPIPWPVAYRESCAIIPRQVTTT